MPVAAAFVTALAVTGGQQPIGPPGADAAIPAPERHPYFGFNETWDQRSKLRNAGRSGADIARMVISWTEVEETRGDRRWRQYDGLYRRTLARGMRPLWVLADAPCWARNVSPERCHEQSPFAHPPSAEHDPDFAGFAARVAKRYPETVAIESWNEPNLWSFWRPEPDPERAAVVTAWANLGVDAVNPAIPVVLGGLSPSLEPDPGEEITYKSFIRDAYAAVGPGHWDAVAIHPFPSFQRSTHYLREIKAHLRRVRTSLDRSGATGTPIWVTEVGLSTAGLRPYSPDDQAKGLARIYRGLANMPDVAAIVVHRLVDQARSLHTAESGWGVIRRDGKRKPSFCALARERGVGCGDR